MRIGHGYDVHRLAEGRQLMLGGVAIPYEKGLDGHSDADVLIHAVMDAILGALALGDIGRHFPDTDAAWRGANSMDMLNHVVALMDDAGFVLGNLDVTIVAQRPKLAAYLPEMRQAIAKTLRAKVCQINVKATTEEGLGFTGNGAGIAAHAVVLLTPKVD